MKKIESILDKMNTKIDNFFNVSAIIGFLAMGAACLLFWYALFCFAMEGLERSVMLH